MDRMADADVVDNVLSLIENKNVFDRT